MLGINDPWIWGVYVLCILSALLCIFYGVANWNKGGETKGDVRKKKARALEEEGVAEKELGL